MLVAIFIIGLSFSFIYLPPVGPTFPEMRNISCSLAASGSPAVLPFPWAALTPSAHTLKAQATRAFWLVPSVFWLSGNADQQCQLGQCSHSTAFTAPWVCGAGAGSTSNGNFCMTVSLEGVVDERVRATAAWSHSWDIPTSQLNRKVVFGLREAFL